MTVKSIIKSLIEHHELCTCTCAKKYNARKQKVRWFTSVARAQFLAQGVTFFIFMYFEIFINEERNGIGKRFGH